MNNVQIKLITYEKGNLGMKKILNTSMIYFILAAAAGVFYREFTKFNGYTGETALSYVHTHLFVLGMFAFLVIALFGCQKPELFKQSTFKKFFILYNISLPFMAVMLLVRGVVQVQGAELTKAADAMISGFAGISHILIGIAVLVLFRSLKKCFEWREQKNGTGYQRKRRKHNQMLRKNIKYNMNTVFNSGWQQAESMTILPILFLLIDFKKLPVIQYK